MRLSVHRDACVRPARRQARPQSSEVTVTTVHRGVWRLALQLAAGDTGRLRVVDAGTVLVRNRGR
jgi:hypothetical protein